MFDGKELLAIYEEIMLRKANTISLKNLDYMKLLMCLKCGDIFSLSKKEKTCGCGETKGLYINDLNAEISGNCQPIGIGNGSFTESLKIQRIENRKPKRKDECCKGIEFTAFFIPETASSIDRVDK
jgi:hypothetical protein